jgi:hypothetical protein
MSRPEAPITSLATEDSVMPAPSRALLKRLTSRERSLISASQ